eukprot:CAMPEP_0117432002 /NCGR_PEP_ID=MMETSP0758-20121206/11540_1 /TAXON_ID=63605 /ORGANISM="Percolomonas cosmopolitus, Strain AE-1 (ATCC 50343)" /LENGTH=206 /DNA_ID=CAMNT_0005221583 /DNA_START=251 /DNA_END=868 /DNA_ORIENTATION=+
MEEQQNKEPKNTNNQNEENKKEQKKETLMEKLSMAKNIETMEQETGNYLDPDKEVVIINGKEKKISECSSIELFKLMYSRKKLGELGDGDFGEDEVDTRLVNIATKLAFRGLIIVTSFYMMLVLFYLYYNDVRSVADFAEVTNRHALMIKKFLGMPDTIINETEETREKSEKFGKQFVSMFKKEGILIEEDIDMEMDDEEIAKIDL